MSILEEVLLEEYERSQQICKALEDEIAALPRGNVRERKMGNGQYFYLQYRDGSKVKSDYIPADEVSRIQNLVAKRKEDVAALKEQRRSQRQIEKALGKDFINEHART